MPRNGWGRSARMQKRTKAEEGEKLQIQTCCRSRLVFPPLATSEIAVPGYPASEAWRAGPATADAEAEYERLCFCNHSTVTGRRCV